MLYMPWGIVRLKWYLVKTKQVEQPKYFWDDKTIHKLTSFGRICTLAFQLMSILPNINYRFKKISIKTPKSYLLYINKLILKLIWECKTLKYPKNTAENNKFEGFIFLELHRVSVIKTEWYQQKSRHTEK